MTFDKIIADVFVRNIERRFESIEAERQAIAAAKQGDEEATVALMYAYAYMLRSGVRWYMRSLPSVPKAADLEDVRSNAVTGLLAAIKAFDLDAEIHDRLAAIAKDHIYEHVSAGAPTAVAAFTVPQRTMSRFFSILREADGNVYEAAALAPSKHMTRETFLAVLSAVRNVDSYEAATEANAGGFDGTTGERFGVGGERGIEARPLWDGSEAEDDALLVEAAFEAVDDLEKNVCEMAYGFTDYDPVPDAEIGHRLGFSRAKAQRVRSSALGKMRNALAVP
ncbi:DNA binding protein [Arthrobacter phage Reedo]|jgi:hypothetical protein|uniref:DNA binding protein n=1 Tax=Arthrobacter phage Reedo TaxID=2910755 RepID=A0AA49BPB2_9CAUD|nr:DNA binding protein [Arthrobacter phage Reedo]UJQ86834.1 DNA binding protein [Arthrobacter phage Reedo]